MSFAQLLFYAAVLFSSSALGQQVTLQQATITLGSSLVSSTTTASLKLSRATSGQNIIWQPNQCFQLYVASPYTTSGVYQTFSAQNPPTCTSKTAGFTVNCQLVPGSTDTLNFWFTSITGSPGATLTQIEVVIQNFITPFSSQNLQTIMMRYYSDLICQAGFKQYQMPQQIIQPQVLPAQSVSVQTSSQVIADTTPDNRLLVTFTPATTMSPFQTGWIYITIPNWYTVGASSSPMYDQRQTNRCFSSSFALTSSSLIGNQIQINYNSMTTTALKGVPITVNCRGFYNPIVPTRLSGFQVTILDGEPIQKVIETSPLVSLDATKFSPMILETTSLSVLPSNTTVNTYSQWNFQINLQKGPPLEQNCVIRLFIPDDFVYKFDSATVSDMFLPLSNMVNGDQLKSSDITVIQAQGSLPMSLVFTGCQSIDSIGATPFGSVQIASLRTQVALKDSGFLGLSIYKDQAMTQLIATLAPGLFIPSGSVQPGLCSKVTISPANRQVQQTTAITFNFTIENQLNGGAKVQINLPIFSGALVFGQNLSVSSVDQSTPASVATVLRGVQSSLSGLPTYILDIQNLVPPNTTDPSGKSYSITVQGLSNQISTKDAGQFSITTFAQFSGQFFMVDTVTIPTSYKATSGNVSSNGTIQFENPVNFARNGVYQFRFITQSRVPPQGFVQLLIPADLQIEPSTALSSGSCKQFQCLNATTQSINIQLPLGLARGSPFNITVGGFINPRSFAPTGPFIINTLDTDGISTIDTGYNLTASMSVSADLQSFSVRAGSVVNGQLNSYTFSIQSNLTIANGDQVTFDLPLELTPPQNSSAMNCTGVTNVLEVKCQINGRSVKVELLRISTPTGAFSWTISNIGNPPSTYTSSSFQNVKLTDKNGFLSLVLKPTTITITNQQPAMILNYTLVQDSLQTGTLTNYTLKFSPVNPIPTNGSLQILYPQQIVLQDGAFTQCIVETSQVYTQSCSIMTESQTITISDVFKSTSSFSGQITVTLQNIINPVINKPGNGFVISTYADDQQTYIQDKLNDFLMTPNFQCAYPCNTCSSTDRNSCLTCWLSDQSSPHFLMNYKSTAPSTCKQSCDPGFTTNGDINKNCVACDPSCATCSDNGVFGDANQCLSCANDYPLRLTNSTKCLSTCTNGLYQTSPQSCDYCKSPCQNCNGTSDTCTSCDQNGLTPYLFSQTCLTRCPVGFLSINGVCQKCISPCAQCSGTLTTCTQCDGTNDTKFIVDGLCQKNCPPHFSPISSNNTCFQCNQDCDLCNINNRSDCFICTKPNISYMGLCVEKCPDKWIINEAGTACRQWTLADAGIIPFPFVAAFIVLSIVVLFGMLSKRGVIVNRKAEMRNVQNTLTCILIVLGPIKSLATCAQWLLSYVNQTQTFALLSLIVTVVNLILNVCFVLWFTKKYIRQVKYVEKVGEKEVVFYDYFDDLLKAHSQKHKISFWIIQILSIGHFHFNKLLYSRFYCRDMFEARFEYSKAFRKSSMIFCIVYIVLVDVLMVAIDITGLIQILPGNQLFITMIETLILSILSIILGGLEIYKMSNILKYTELTKREKLVIHQAELARRALAGAKSKEQRAEDIEDIIMKVKNNKSKFLNNKLDELLGVFGDRSCKSMIDHTFGEDKEKDNRELLSWPMSPASKSNKFRRMDFQFTEADVERFLALQDNCYAELRIARKGNDFGTQGDAGLLEFQDALNRKHGGLMSQIEGDAEEQRIKKQVRRRGRKNKYYTQIDLEDDLEADQAEGSDRENQLQVIKEQEEEDEALRKLVSADAKRSLEAAANRKSKLAEDQLAKQRQEQEEQEARRLKELQIQESLRLKAEQEQKILAEQIRREAELQSQLEAERLREEQANKMLEHQETLKNAQLRAEYEAQEAEKQAKALEDAARKRQEEEEKAAQELLQQRLAREQELQNAKKLQEERDAKALELKQKLLADEQLKKLNEDRREGSVSRQGAADAQSEMNQSVHLADEILSSFKQFESKIDVPPKAELRTFNENDILGDLDRDDKGNVVVLQGQDGKNRDLQGQLTNQRGYLQDPKTGDIIENQTSKVMFSHSQMDSRGEIPAPFCLEKYNFNPHQIFGDFDFDRDGKPNLLQTTKGFSIDKKGRRVNKFGWMTLAGQGHLVDQHGRKKFDRKQLVNEGDLPKLFNYLGKRFDIKDVMGQFEKDQNGLIIPCSSEFGLVDNIGRRINERGYLVDETGNIIDINGKLLWKQTDLKSGEFPKIFPFTKFNIQRVQGDFEMNPSGNPILKKRVDGKLIDNKGQVVNQRGYLIDSSDNIIDHDGNIMFDKIVLDQDGEIPAVFRTGLLKSDTASSLSRLMSEIEKNHPSEFDRNEEGKFEDLRGLKNEGETSVDSQMEDTPANYNQANQRFDERDLLPENPIPEDEEANEHMSPQSEFDAENSHLPTLKRRRKKKKNKLTTIELLEPTLREKNMADAYGGQAKGELRRPGVKYDKERLAGSKKFRVATADEPKVRAQLQQLVNSNSGLHQLIAVKQGSSQKSKELPAVKIQGLMGVTNGFDSNDGLSQISKSQRRGGSRRGVSRKSDSRKADSRAMIQAPPKGSRGKRVMQDGDFEQMFGKDIDQFLEDSEWDIESLDKVSRNSRDSAKSAANEMKLKQMEKLYLKRIGGDPQQPMHTSSVHKGSRDMIHPNSKISRQVNESPSGAQNLRRREPKPERETIIGYTDDPGVLHRGEILEFKTKK